ncbi:glycoside hydrolase family 130 protein [Leptolinea tardivitalis]|uniref:Glycosidase n=1 Tax=Leptolinea tardivitalis TaxID=229920 RepID=A0A0P6WP78_9CHLR|nr:glycoside hydrolase family 130 protein [Leptolinea tardivitalis]KPL70569.1 glycosidase [Leptolinea tardivitalis]GAP22177.1 predicted glycosylase [Leptolinea tardivitalis]
MAIDPTLHFLPWEDRPAGCSDVVWRYSQNPIIPRDLIPSSNSIFNSAVVPFNGEFRGVFRVDNKKREMNLHSGSSKDGLHFTLKNDPIEWIHTDPELAKFEYRYDPRVTWIEDRYYVSWCNGFYGPTIGLGYTYDFEKFYFLENALLPYNRNGVLFPRRINGKYVMFSRPSDNGHTPFGNIYLSQSPDMIHWGEHRFVMGTKDGWQSTKIGAGPTPIETKEGWLLFYHGVITSCNGFVYSFGAALLDLDQPWKVIYRSAPYLLSPQTIYECVGDVPNVAFPCASLYQESTGKIAIYYGGADTVTALAFCKVDEVLDFLKKNSEL